jgi:hypothetical protein
MNIEDDYYDGDMSDNEYRQRIAREKERDAFYAREAAAHRQRQAASKIIYPKVSDDYDDDGMMY